MTVPPASAADNYLGRAASSDCVRLQSDLGMNVSEGRFKPGSVLSLLESSVAHEDRLRADLLLWNACGALDADQADPSP